jgi:tRNA threonylcarbamoyl adenosine modification protein YeaZ
MVLSIDTSSAYAGIALAADGNILAELTWNSGQWHTVDLVPGIEFLFKMAKINKKDVKAVFVATGPGSFNGLRVGISAAKGIAYSLEIPIVGISTMEIAAFPFAFSKVLMCSIHGAGRSEIAVSFFRETVDGWKCLEEAYLSTVDDLCNKISETTIFCGEIPETAIEQLKSKLGEKAIIPPPEARMRRGSFLVSLGMQRLKEGKADDVSTLQPVYLRPPPITERKVK